MTYDDVLVGKCITVSLKLGCLSSELSSSRALLGVQLPCLPPYTIERQRLSAWLVATAAAPRVLALPLFSAPSLLL